MYAMLLQSSPAQAVMRTTYIGRLRPACGQTIFSVLFVAFPVTTNQNEKGTLGVTRYARL